MIKNFFIVVLAVLLGISAYLLYTNKNVTINLGGGNETARNVTPSEDTPHEQNPGVSQKEDTAETAKDAEFENREQVETLQPDKEPEVHLEPTVGMTISTEKQIVSDYKIIGPRKFSLLTDDDETMVEIDLDTGNVKINPKYKVDDVTAQFWKSIGKKYPEVCFVESDSPGSD